MATYHFSKKSGGKGSAAKHARYIVRTGMYREKEDDLVAHWSGNLPAWSAGDPGRYWNQADRSERKNGAVYREYEIALPRELNSDQHIEIVKKVINLVCTNKAHQVAVHSPPAAMDGGDQPHVHLMVSDRLEDGIEREPAQHFRRYNAANPHLGGCRKDSGGKSPTMLREAMKSERKLIADLINSALAEHGFEDKVDHRSNKDRGIEQEPGHHLGPYGVSQKKMQKEN